MIVRLTIRDFGLLHSECKFWKLTDLKFKRNVSYASLFGFKLSSSTKIDIEINESIITNFCISFPFEDLFVTLDMEWRELDSELKFKYGYK